MVFKFFFSFSKYASASASQISKYQINFFVFYLFLKDLIFSVRKVRTKKKK
jgi:hypothetical protein